MKLTVFPRTAKKKSDAKKVRRQGQIPAVVYGVDQANHNVYLQSDELQAIFRKMRPGLLATTLFELQEGNKTYKALVKEIQYHPATYAVLHIDFALVFDDKPVTVNVPIQLAGIAECVGAKLGGFVRPVVRALKVNCLPKDLPEVFVLDVTALDIAQSMTLSQIAMPEGVRPMMKMNEVAVVVAKKA